jgi:hypothetical protein
MPPLASLAASLLVASPPLAACGPPCRFRRRRRKPSLPSAYPQPTLNLPSNAFPCRSRRPLLATSERSSRADHLILLSACHAQGTRAEWAPLKLNTTNCRPGHGKMQVSFSHVGSGGARKTPPLSLGTWPTEGPGHEEALRWYMNVQSKLHPLRGKVGPTDVRVQHLMLACRQAAKAAKANEAAKQVRIPARILERTSRILCVSVRVPARVSLLTLLRIPCVSSRIPCVS